MRVVQTIDAVQLGVTTTQVHRRKLLLDRLPLVQRTLGTAEPEENRHTSAPLFAQAVVSEMWHQAMVQQMVNQGSFHSEVQEAMSDMPEMSDDLIDALVSIVSDSWDAMSAIFGKVFKVVLGFLQINASFQMTLPQISWSADLSSVWGAFAIFNFDFLSFGSLNETTRGAVNYCTTSLWMCAAYLVWQLTIPLFARVLTCVFKTNSSRRAAFFDKMVALSIIILLVVYPTLSTRLLNMYQVRAFGDKQVLAADWSLDFGDLTAYQAVGGVFLLLYTAGIPAFFLYAAYITGAPKEEESHATLKERLAAQEKQLQREDRYVKLTEMYEAKNWYWEVVETLRKLILIAGLVFIFPGTTTQVWISLLISLLFLGLTTYHMPFNEFALDVLSFVSQICTALTLLLALTAKTDLLDDKIIGSGTLDAISLICQLLPLLVGVGVLMYVVKAKLDMRRNARKMSTKLPGFLLSRPEKKKRGNSKAEVVEGHFKRMSSEDSAERAQVISASADKDEKPMLV